MKKLASTKQITFINSLLEERDLSEPEVTSIKVKCSDADFSVADASEIISTLVRKPRKPKGEGALERMRRERLEAYEGIENSYYAIPEAVFRLLPEFADFRGDLLFLRVYTYKGHRYMRRLVGAPGAFGTYRVGHSAEIALCSVLRGFHVQYATLFGEHYARCGRCTAELTDQRSRELHLGPECRRIWGIK